MAPRVDKSTVKSTRKPSPIERDPSLRGRGPAKGAPNAGRPPSLIRASMREALADRLHILADIADDPTVTPTERMKALDLLGKYGMGTTTAVVDSEGQDVPPPQPASPQELAQLVAALKGEA